jgi:hypothetical protein
MVQLKARLHELQATQLFDLPTGLINRNLLIRLVPASPVHH